MNPDQLQQAEDAAITRQIQDAEFRKYKPEWWETGLDPVIAESLRPFFTQTEALQKAHEKAGPRRFTGALPTGLGDL